MKDRTCISTSIDLTNEFDRQLYEHVKKKGNQSKYLRHLIYTDIMLGARQLTTTIVTAQEEEEEDSEAANSFF